MLVEGGGGKRRRNRGKNKKGPVETAQPELAVAAEHPLTPENEVTENDPVQPETDAESQTNVDALQHLPPAGDSDQPENGAAKSETDSENQKSPDETTQLHAAHLQMATEHHIFESITQVTTRVTHHHAFLAHGAALVATAVNGGPETAAATADSESPGSDAQLEVEGGETKKKKRNKRKKKNGRHNELQQTRADSSVVENVLNKCRAEKSQESTQTKHETGKPDIHTSSAHQVQSKKFKKKQAKTAASAETLGMVSIQYAKQVYIRFHVIFSKFIINISDGRKNW